MANERQTFDSPEFRPEDEIDDLFGRANPNPTRVGCPTREVLIALAHRERPIDDPAYEHLAKCSACYREFRSIQQASSQKIRRSSFGVGSWLAVAAAVVLVALGGLWVFSSSRENRSRSADTAPPQQAKTTDVAMELDLRRYTVTRNEQQKRDVEPLSLTRGRLKLTIFLPVGSEPGRYEIQVLDSGLRSRESTTGEAQIRNYVTTLQATMDLQSLAPGAYQLALRHETEDWRLFPAEVK